MRFCLNTVVCPVGEYINRPSVLVAKNVRMRAESASLFLLGGEVLSLLLLVLLFYIQCHQMTALVSSVDQYSMADRSLIWYSLLEVRTWPYMFRLVVRLFSINRFF